MKKNHFIGRHRAFFLVTVLFSGIAFSCQEDDKDLVKPKTVTDVILENSQFSILREIIAGTEMGDALRTNELTLFAPNDAAFNRSGITASSITSLPRQSGISFVNNHILNKPYRTEELKSGNLAALNGKNLTIAKSTGSDSTIRVNRAVIVQKNINADNGVIHIVDRVLADQ